VELPGIDQHTAFASMVDIAAQERWMIATRLFAVDAPQRVPRVGSRVAAFTGIGGLGFLDTMTVTAYEPPERWVVAKDGRLLRGVGIMQVQATADGCRARWINELELPFGILGRLGFPLVRPLVEVALRACLRRMARLLRTGTLPLADHRPDADASAQGAPR
jgi:hypothetical protein